MNDTPPPADTVPDQPDPPIRGRWLLRGVLAIMTLCVVLGLGIGGAILYLTDRPVSAPEWLRERIAQRVAENAPDLQISAGDIRLTVNRGWRPSVQMDNVVVRSADGIELIGLSRLEASLAMRPLLEGQVQPKTVLLSGIFATARRDRDGTIDLIGSPTGGQGRRAATLAQLVGQVDKVFLRPEMSALTEIAVDAVTLRFEDARAARVWTIDGARMRAEREEETLRLSSDLAILSGGADAATVSANYTTQLGDPQAQFGISVDGVLAEDLAAFSPAFGWMAGLQAPLSGSLRGGVSDMATLSPINAALQIRAGVLQPTPQSTAVPFNAARAYLTFDPAESELQFDELSIDSAWIKGRMDGRASLAGLEQGKLDTLVAQLRLSNLEINPPNLYATPLLLEGAELDVRLVPDPFRLDLGQVRVIDQGRSMRMDGSLSATDAGWQAAVNAHLPELTPARLLELWPAQLGGKIRDWLVNNLLEGALSGLEFALRADPGSKPDVFFSFDYDQARVRYLPTFPPVEQAKGTASMLRDRFVVTVDQGIVPAKMGGDLDVAGSSFIIPDVAVKDGAPAVVRLRTDGSITATLAMLDQDPLQLISKADLPVTLAEGRAIVDTTLGFPLRKGVPADQISYRARAQLSDVETTKLIDGRRIVAPVLDVNVTPQAIEIEGDGRFDGIPVQASWAQTLGAGPAAASVLNAQVELSNDAVTALNLGLPPGSVTGRGLGQLTLQLPRGAPATFTLASDLDGVGLQIPALGWSLPNNRRAELRIAGTLGATPSIERLALDAPGLDASGRISVNAAGGLARAQFDRVRVGGWLDAPVTLVGRGPGAAPEVQVRGGRLDLRAAAFGSGGGGGGSNAAGPLSLALDRLQITDTIAVTGMRGDFDLRRGLQGQFSGRVNGSAPVTGQVEPQDGRSAFRIKSNDAGQVFSAAGLLKQARGGVMSLTLQPVGTAGGFNGALSITNTRIKDAPAIAALFNALSVVGLLEQMGGQGLHFAEVDAAFRLTPDRVTLTQASAVGPSIGLSMDGIYDVNTSQMDMQGVFSPIYLLNGLGSVLTRRGEGVIGFNFRLTGPASKPKVQVNPLSALAPSFLREIFRRPAPKITAEPGETPGNAPKLAPRQRAPVRDGSLVGDGAQR